MKRLADNLVDQESLTYVSECGNTLLHILAEDGDFELMELVLNLTADKKMIFAHNDANMRPLDISVRCNNVETTKILVRFGAEIFDTHLEWAMAHSNNALIDILANDLLSQKQYKHVDVSRNLSSVHYNTLGTCQTERCVLCTSIDIAVSYRNAYALNLLIRLHDEIGDQPTVVDVPNSHWRRCWSLIADSKSKLTRETVMTHLLVLLFISNHPPKRAFVRNEKFKECNHPHNNKWRKKPSLYPWNNMVLLEDRDAECEIFQSTNQAIEECVEVLLGLGARLDVKIHDLHYGIFNTSALTDAYGRITPTPLFLAMSAGVITEKYIINLFVRTGDSLNIDDDVNRLPRRNRLCDLLYLAFRAWKMNAFEAILKNSRCVGKTNIYRTFAIVIQDIIFHGKDEGTYPVLDLMLHHGIDVYLEIPFNVWTEEKMSIFSFTASQNLDVVMCRHRKIMNYITTFHRRVTLFEMIQNKN